MCKPCSSQDCALAQAYPLQDGYDHKRALKLLAQERVYRENKEKELRDCQDDLDEAREMLASWEAAKQRGESLEEWKAAQQASAPGSDI